MDWFIPAGAADVARVIRREITEYLERHAEPAADGSPGDDGVAESALMASELIGNAVRHTDGPSWVSLRWPGDHPVLTVADLRPGFVLPELDASSASDIGLSGGSPGAGGGDPDSAPPATHGRGLRIIGELASRITVTSRSGPGAVVEVVLPVHRRPQRSIDPRRSSTSRLPDLTDARPESGFDREVFLQALVVQMAQTVERQAGPDVSEAAVAQVGTDVGAQMEAEYRAATGAAGALTPAQMAEAYVRLKAGIGGRFSVESVDDRTIVLSNTACPFGDVVTRAPALCRMTSSVFGGIAARNTTGGAAVTLEERIAVGDHQCRVVIELDPQPAALSAGAHHYASPPADAR